MVGIRLPVDVNEARSNISAARGVDALVRGIVPEVVDAGDTLELRDLLARVRIKNDQRGRSPGPTKQPVVVWIDRQGDHRYRSRPGLGLLALLPVEHANFSSSRKRHEDSRPRC